MAEKNHIEENAWKLEAPLLAGLQKPILRIPQDGYFDALKQGVLQEIREEDFHVLAGLSKPVTAEPGDYYFESLTARVMKQIGKQDVPVVPLYSLILKYTSLAACIAGSIWFFRFPAEAQLQASPETAVMKTFEEKVDDLKDYSFMFETEELAAFVSEQKAQSAEFSPAVDELSRDVNTEDLESLVE